MFCNLHHTIPSPNSVQICGRGLPNIRSNGLLRRLLSKLLIAEGKYADVPFIIGDQEDEGTLFALFQSNITTIPELVDYLSIFYFHNATRAQIEALVATYPDVTTDKEYLNRPRWSTSNQLLNSYATTSVLLADNFRQDMYDFILNKIANLHI